MEESSTVPFDEFQCLANFQIPFDLFVSKKHKGLGSPGNLRFTDSAGNLVYMVRKLSHKSADNRPDCTKKLLLDSSGNTLFTINRGKNVWVGGVGWGWFNGFCVRIQGPSRKSRSSMSLQSSHIDSLQYRKGSWDKILGEPSTARIKSASGKYIALMTARIFLALEMGGEFNKMKGSWQGFRGNDEEKNLIFIVDKTLDELTRTEFKILLLGENNRDSKTELQMKGCPFKRACTIYKDDSIVAETSLMYKLGIGKIFVPRNRFRVTIFPGFDDHCLVASLIVIYFDGRRLWI
ncbi:protein LURP-one-related 7 [Sesamum angolense]|uniref:Protein LURP-one-related 7 n=1 Tax=Sesamum angolense TaxID=2727404 RepID=A0AAE1X9E4_9LAMI|nr:protein LURP-one-related 7 [Sesamum angolense]